MSPARHQNLKAYKFCSALWKGISPNVTGQVLIYSAISSRCGSTNSVEQEVQQMALIKISTEHKRLMRFFSDKRIIEDRSELVFVERSAETKVDTAAPRVWLISHKGKMLQSRVLWKICMSRGGWLSSKTKKKLYDGWKRNMLYNQWYIR